MITGGWHISAIDNIFLGSYDNGFCLGPLFPTVISLVPQFVAPRLVPSAVGFLACLGSGGAAFFPWIAGYALQHLGYWCLPPFALLLAVLMWGVWLALSRVPTAQSE